MPRCTETASSEDRAAGARGFGSPPAATASRSCAWATARSSARSRYGPARTAAWRSSWGGKGGETLLSTPDRVLGGGGLVEVLVDAAGPGGSDVSAASLPEHHHHDFWTVGGRVRGAPTDPRTGPGLARHGHVPIRRA